MEFDLEKVIQLIEVIMFTQGVLFGIQFTIFSKYSKPTFFLGLFLIAFAMDDLQSFIQITSAGPVNSNIELFPTSLIFLGTPLFYLYARQVSVLKNKKRHYWLLLPGIIEFGVLFILYSQNTPDYYLDSIFYILYLLIGIVFNVVLVIKIIQFAQVHIKSVENQYASTAGKQLIWVKQFSISLLFFVISSMLLGIFIGEDYLIYVELYITIFLAILIYWIIFQGFSQKNVELLITDDINDVENNRSFRTDSIDDKELYEIMNTVNTYLTSSKVYTNKELTIIDIAKAIKIPPKKVSKAINCIKKENFKTYINKLRIQEVLKCIESKNYTNYSLEGIGSEAGFKSKSVFYSTFKKEKNCTPMEYKQHFLSQKSTKT